MAHRETIARVLGLSVASINVYMALLRRRGYVEIERKRRATAVVTICERARVGSGFEALVNPRLITDYKSRNTPLTVELDSRGANTGAPEAGPVAADFTDQLETAKARGQDLAVMLRDAGVWTWAIPRLIGYPARRIRAAVLAVANRPDVTNPGAWVASAVRQDWKHPARIWDQVEDRKAAELVQATRPGRDLLTIEEHMARHGVSRYDACVALTSGPLVLTS
tara:strand:- start:2 stop:670 length:669 start_codon:yes stop_codon:yes gene_type:complete